MNCVGVDIHKRYSVLVAVDERGWELARGRIGGNSASGRLAGARLLLDEQSFSRQPDVTAHQAPARAQ
jgi:hypothetical protein